MNAFLYMTWSAFPRTRYTPPAPSVQVGGVVLRNRRRLGLARGQVFLHDILHLRRAKDVQDVMCSAGFGGMAQLAGEMAGVAHLGFVAVGDEVDRLRVEVVGVLVHQLRGDRRRRALREVCARTTKSPVSQFAEDSGDPSRLALCRGTGVGRGAHRTAG